MFNWFENFFYIKILSQLEDTTKLVETVVVSLIALWVFGLIFFICELGERGTYHFDIFREELVQFNWLTQSIHLKRMYLIFLSDTMRPKNIGCYGNVLCARVTFRKVHKWDNYFDSTNFNTWFKNRNLKIKLH